MILRRMIIVAVALLLAVQVARNAAVEAFATLQPTVAAKFWAGHPAVEISSALTAIGRAARLRQPIDKSVFARVEDAARKAPLASEPFLVAGVRAQTSADDEAARRAFVDAQWRDPRSLPAAYFLAQYYLRSGRPLEGLKETTLLARLTPGGQGAATPFLAAYAQNPANWPQIRSLFKSQESLEDSVLEVLATDSRNTDAILAIADARHRTALSRWVPILLRRLVANGDYGRARAIWSAISQVPANGQLIFDPTFSIPTPPPPFNWSLASSTVGLAERQPGRRLHAIFYGTDDGVLASELLLLPPGTYNLQAQLVGAPLHPETLVWSIRCDKAREPLASSDPRQLASGGMTFQVPANCAAQWIELSGRSGDISQQAEVTVTGLRITMLPRSV